jgi:hypothetical protein
MCITPTRNGRLRTPERYHKQGVLSNAGGWLDGCPGNLGYGNNLVCPNGLGDLQNSI